MASGGYEASVNSPAKTKQGTDTFDVQGIDGVLKTPVARDSDTKVAVGCNLFKYATIDSRRTATRFSHGAVQDHELGLSNVNLKTPLLAIILNNVKLLLKRFLVKSENDEIICPCEMGDVMSRE